MSDVIRAPYRGTLRTLMWGLGAGDPWWQFRGMTEKPPAPRLRLRIVFPDQGMIGPGKAELLALIQETGSIAAAGRRLGMSYKRAWSLVETLNAMFALPVVESTRVGASHGGARLTSTGETVLALYLAFAEKAAIASAGEVAALERLLAKPAAADAD